jgi:hypothetical protein
MTDIVALKEISLSELQTIDSRFTEEWVEQNPKELEAILSGLGLDINQPYEKQYNTHRNKFNNVITCSRWVGSESISEEWIKSGYASQEAIDKSKGNKLLVDLYRSKGLTTDRHAGVWEPEDDKG